MHVVVVQWRQRNVQKSVMDVQSCCFAKLKQAKLIAFLPFSLTSLPWLQRSVLEKPSLGASRLAVAAYQELGPVKGGRVGLVLGLASRTGLPFHSHISSFFIWRVYKAGRVTLALGLPYLSARVTLARGLPYLPCERSARDNSPTRVNFPPSCVTSNRANLNGIIQFLSLIINIGKIKNYFLCTMIIFSPFFVN